MNSHSDIHRHHPPQELVPELYTLLFQSHPLQAVRRVMEVTNCRLSDAITEVNTIWAHMCQQLPEPIEHEVRVLLATGDHQGAIDRISERTGMGVEDSTAYVEMLTPSIQVHVSEAETRELLALYIQGKKLDAAERIRAKNRVGLAAAIAFLDLLLTTTADNASAAPQSEANRTAHPPNLLPSKAPDLASNVQRQIEQIFPQADWEGVGAILSLYGEKAHEPESERVQLAVLRLIQGNPHKLLQLVESAKQDYRDVLYWASTQP